MDKTVVWFGAPLDPSGYGEASRNYLLGLKNYPELKLKLVNRQFWHGDKLDVREYSSYFQELSNRAVSQDGECVYIFNLTPENFICSKHSKTHIGMTTFETDRVPGFWLVYMRAMDEIWTYTQFNKETFQNAGVNRPIRVIPHGVDIDRFNPEAAPMQHVREATAGKFVFGSNFDWTERKNPTTLLRAYLTEFGPDDDVVMILKSYYQYPISQSMSTMKSKINKMKQDLGLSTEPKKTAPIMILDNIIPPNMMPSFYTSIDCYVSPSRGEGWGLCFSEAMSSGLPTIGVGWSGNTEFMNQDNSFLLNYDLVDVSDDLMREQPHYVGHKWASCSHEELGQVMRFVRDNPEVCKKKGIQARKDMEEKWTWKHAAKKLSDAIKEVM